MKQLPSRTELFRARVLTRRAKIEQIELELKREKQELERDSAFLANAQAEEGDRDANVLSAEVVTEAIIDVVSKRADGDRLDETQLRKEVRRQLRTKSPTLQLPGLTTAVREGARSCSQLRLENGGYSVVRERS